MSDKIIDITELKLLLALNGSQRIPHLEDDIAENAELSPIYLRILWDAETNCDSVWIPTIGCAYSAYQYARDILHTRWKFAENLILASNAADECTNGDIITAYSYNVIKDRWRAAEPILKNNTYWYGTYCRHWLITSEQDPPF